MLRVSPTEQCIEGSEMGVKYDLFPAFVTIAAPGEAASLDDVQSGPPRPTTARSFDKARVIVYTERIIIAVDGDQGPKIILDEAYPAGTFIRSGDRSTDSKLTTNLGFHIAFKRNDACGCGSRLRSWNPYRTLSSTKDPTE